MMSAGTRLLALMETQRAVLLSGDVAALPDIARAMERLLAGLDQAQLSELQMNRIASEAGRNAALLMAAQRGVRSVHDRKRGAEKGHFGSYDAKGRRTSFGTDGQRLQARS